MNQTTQERLREVKLPCKRCGELKSISELRANKGCRYGVQKICRVCDAARAKELYQTNRLQKKISVDAYRKTEQGKKVVRAAADRIRIKRNDVWKQVRAAVIKGELTKPNSCENCNTLITDNNELHGHHSDYSKPLDVIWLCRECHMVAHNKKPIEV